MDDRGFIFTTDATLAMVVLIVFTASLVTYTMLPVYLGSEHQHLESMAESALAVMEQDGTLRTAAVYYANNNTTEAQSILSSELDSLLPSDVSYKMTLSSYTPVVNDRGRSYQLTTDVATKVRVVSGPQEGWLGRSYYNVKEVDFVDQNFTTTSTLWNFHNWLTNYYPSSGWNPSTYWNNYGLNNLNSWGATNSINPVTPVSIQYPVPSTTTGTVNWAKIIIGAADSSSSLQANNPTSIYLNNNLYADVPRANFTRLYQQDSGNQYYIYNYIGNLNPTRLAAGQNNSFYLRYNLDSYNRGIDNMPWFSIIANYTTTLQIPQGVTNNYYYMPNSAGLAYPTPGVSRSVSGYQYNLDSGAVNSFTTTWTRNAQPPKNRIISYDNYVNNNYGIANDGSTFENSQPFVITNIPNSGSTYNTAICSMITIDNTNVGYIKDAYLSVNAWGAMDGALVEVWDGTRWNTIFSSMDNSAISSGYGNIPGMLNLKDSLSPGKVNKVRVTIWDNAPGGDYDLCGLYNCYAMVSSTKLPISWDVYPYVSHQSSSGTESQTRQFNVTMNNTKDVILVFGGGQDPRTVKVDYGNNSVLYEGTPPYILSLAELDANRTHVMTSGTPTNYTILPGNYNLRVTVTAPASWESGDGASNPPAYSNAELFSGTRIMVIGPALLRNVWSSSYADNPQTAQDKSYAELITLLKDQGFTDQQINRNLIVNETLFAGDIPNNVPARLELWTH